MPISCKISRPCSPSRGGSRSIAAGVSANCTGGSGITRFALGRMLHVLEEADRVEMRIGDHLVEGLHRPGRDFQLVERRDPIRGLAAGQLLAGQPIDLVDVAAPRRHIGKSRIRHHLRPADLGPEPPPLRVGVGQHAEIAVRGAIRPPPRRQHARIARLALRRIEAQAVQMLDHDERHHGLEHRDFDELPAAGLLAGIQRRQDRLRRHQPAGLVAQDGRRVARLAGQPVHQARDAAQALDDVVIGRPPAVGPVLAPAVNAGIDQPRIALAERVRAEPQRLELLRPDVVDEHVGPIDQPQQHLARRRGLQVEHDAALVAVDPHEQRGHVAADARPGVARGVALRRLDLDDVGAEIAQHLRGVGPEHHRGEIEHAHARERTGISWLAETLPRSTLS